MTEIEFTKDRKIDRIRIRIRLDESIPAYLESETPSADTGTEGVSPIVGAGGSFGRKEPRHVPLGLGPSCRLA